MKVQEREVIESRRRATRKASVARDETIQKGSVGAQKSNLREEPRRRRGSKGARSRRRDAGE